MIIFLPVLLLLLGGAAIGIVRSVLPRFRYSWMIVTGALFAAAISLLFLPFKNPVSVSVSNWSPFSTYQLILTFSFNTGSWMVGFLLVSMVLGGILSSVIDNPDVNPERSWVSILFMTSLGLLAVISADPVSLVIIWSVTDLFILLMAIRTARIAGGRISAINFGAHLFASMNALWFLCIDLQGRKVPGFEILNDVGLLFILLAVLLRFQPIIVFPSQEPGIQKAHLTIQSFLTICSSFILLQKIDAWPSSSNSTTLMLWAACIFSVFHLARLIRQKENQKKQISSASLILGLAVIAVLIGNTSALSAWIGFLLIIGSILFFFSKRTRRLTWLGILVCLVATGIPFSPFAAIWNGFSSPGLFTILFAIIMGLVLYYVGKQVLFPNEQKIQGESWVQIIYPFGLVTLLVSPYIAVMKIGFQFTVSGFWYGSVIAIVEAGIVFLLARILPSRFTKIEKRLDLNPIFLRISSFLQKAASLKWLGSVGIWIAGVVQSFINLLSRILESDGGLLWSFLLFILVLTLVKAGVK